MTDTLILLATIVFLLLVALWTLLKERHYATITLTDAADAAVRQVRHVAHRRARASSTPIPDHLQQEETPVEGVSLPGPAITVTIGPDTAEIPRVPRPVSAPYAIHKRRGNLKISER